ncbi:MAG: hypothetical protein HZA82_00200, partial [Thaumarchaeota archaeon]|nr:hypothetical protein [Nitrososphaerota archaeon]
MLKRFFVFLFVLPFVLAVVSSDCPDVKNDGVIDVFDLVKMVQAITNSDLSFDVSGDGKVDVSDLQVIGTKFGITCSDSDYANLVGSLGLSTSLQSFNTDQELSLQNAVNNFKSKGYERLYDYDSYAYSQAIASGQSKAAVDSDFSTKYAGLRSAAKALIYSSCRTNQNNVDFENYYTVFLRAAVYENLVLNGGSNYNAALDVAKSEALVKMQDNADCVIPVFVFAGQANIAGSSALASELPSDLQQANAKALFLNSDTANFAPLTPPT